MLEKFSSFRGKVLEHFKVDDSNFHFFPNQKVGLLYLRTEIIKQGQQLSDFGNIFYSCINLLDPESNGLEPEFDEENLIFSSNIMSVSSTGSQVEDYNVLKQASHDLQVYIQTYGYLDDDTYVLQCTNSDGRVVILTANATPIADTAGGRVQYKWYDGQEWHSSVFLQTTGPVASVAMYILPAYNTGGYNPISVLSLIKAINADSEIYDVIQESIGACTSSDSATFKNVLARFSSFGQSAALVVNDVIAAHATGQSTGVLSYIKQLFHAAETVAVSSEDSNVIEFTDYSVYAPQDWLAGITATAVTTIGALVSTISIIAGGIVGIVGAVIGVGASIIGQAISTNFNSATRAQFYNGEDGIPIYPIPIYQRKGDYLSTVAEDQFGKPRYMLCNEQTPLLVHSGSRYSILATYTGQYGQERLTESFIDLKDRLSYIKSHASDFVTYESSSYPMGYSFSFNLQYWRSVDADQENSTSGSLTYDSQGILDANSDKYLRLLILTNFVYCVLSQYYNHPNELAISELASNSGWELCFSGQPATDTWYYYNAFPEEKRAFVKLFCDALTWIGAYVTNTNVANVEMDWEDIYNLFNEFNTNCQSFLAKPDETTVIIADARIGNNNPDIICWYVDEYPATLFSSAITPVVVPPKYGVNKLRMQLAAVAAMTVITIVTTAVLAVKIKRWNSQRKAISAAKVEQAYTNFVKDPTANNYKLYKRAVRSNNIQSDVFGGNKYSKINYWDDTTKTPTGKLVNVSLTDLLRYNNDSSLEQVIKLIKG